MSYFFQLLGQYKWSISLSIIIFIVCLLILSFGIGMTILVVLVTAAAGFIGFLKDRQIKLSELIRNFK